MKRHSVGNTDFRRCRGPRFCRAVRSLLAHALRPGADSRRTDDSAPFDTFTVARTRDLVTAIGGLRVVPDYAWSHAPLIDILVVPGGFGTRALLRDQPTIDWIREAAASASLVTSVCTGALLLAKAGLLNGRRATTHWAALDLLGVDRSDHSRRARHSASCPTSS